jgi:FtsH-binding integral membrane protein
MIGIFGIFTFVFMGLGLLYSKTNKDGSVMFMFIVAGIFHGLTLMELVNLIKG